MKNKVGSTKSNGNSPTVIHVDGAGQGPFGTGSGYGWIDVDRGQHEVVWKDGLTNNEAEWRAIRLAVKRLDEGSAAEIQSDSQLMVNQFNELYAIRDPKLKHLARQVREIIKERRLHVTVTWIPREHNRADRLLSKKDLAGR